MKKYLSLILVVLFLLIPLSVMGEGQKSFSFVENHEEYVKHDTNVSRQFEMTNLTPMRLKVELWFILGKTDENGKVEVVKQIMVEQIIEFQPKEAKYINVLIPIEIDDESDCYKFSYLIETEAGTDV